MTSAGHKMHCSIWYGRNTERTLEKSSWGLNICRRGWTCTPSSPAETHNLIIDRERSSYKINIASQGCTSTITYECCRSCDERAERVENTTTYFMIHSIFIINFANRCNASRLRGQQVFPSDGTTQCHD